MADLWGALGALVAIVAPIALAGWLLVRPNRSRRGERTDRRGKMSSER